MAIWMVDDRACIQSSVPGGGSGALDGLRRGRLPRRAVGARMEHRW